MKCKPKNALCGAIFQPVLGYRRSPDRPAWAILAGRFIRRPDAQLTPPGYRVTQFAGEVTKNVSLICSSASYRPLTLARRLQCTRCARMGRAGVNRMTASEYMSAITREEKRGAADAQNELACCPPIIFVHEYDQATRTQFACIRSAYYRGYGTSMHAQEGRK